MIEEALEKITARFDVPQAGLVTPEAGDYPFLPQLVDRLIEKKIGVSFASLRLDRLSEQMITALAGSGRHSITVAPETGGEALRFGCGKKFTDDLILEKLAIDVYKRQLHTRAVCVLAHADPRELLPHRRPV